jgi:MmeI, N-terminal domain
VPISGDEIRLRLEQFVERWSDYSGTERAEAQSFLNELLACYGVDRKEVAHFEDPTGAGIIDMLWPAVCIVEMKRPGEAGNLAAHREQAFAYWQDVSSQTGRAGSHVVVCAFRRFEVFEPGVYWTTPIATFDLDALPAQHEAPGSSAASKRASSRTVPS